VVNWPINHKKNRYTTSGFFVLSLFSTIMDFQ
jgi:hypothetical protein